MQTPPLVCAQDWGIPGLNYYFINRQRKNISLEELAAVGIVDDKSYVHCDLIVPLLWVIAQLTPHGYSILLEDAYRSPATYELARRKLVTQEGEEVARRLFNMADMPHATARAIDLSLIDSATGQKVWLRNDGRDGLEAKFVGFYQDREDEESRLYQQRQDLLHDIMQRAGFVFGSKREIWHFELPESITQNGIWVPS